MSSVGDLVDCVSALTRRDTCSSRRASDAGHPGSTDERVVLRPDAM
jgi:hypothetical protein